MTSFNWQKKERKKREVKKTVNVQRKKIGRWKKLFPLQFRTQIKIYFNDPVEIVIAVLYT